MNRNHHHLAFEVTAPGQGPPTRFGGCGRHNLLLVASGERAAQPGSGATLSQKRKSIAPFRPHRARHHFFTDHSPNL
jgi:hypothetical protein